MVPEVSLRTSASMAYADLPARTQVTACSTAVASGGQAILVSAIGPIVSVVAVTVDRRVAAIAARLDLHLAVGDRQGRGHAGRDAGDRIAADDPVDDPARAFERPVRVSDLAIGQVHRHAAVPEGQRSARRARPSRPATNPLSQVSCAISGAAQPMSVIAIAPVFSRPASIEYPPADVVAPGAIPS